jgi:small-conductance mechanosensitive channel
MNRAEKIAAGGCAALLIGCVAAAWLTRETQAVRTAGPASVVDRRLLDTARQLSALAETAAEAECARQAVRLADHELDQAFASAVREAANAKPSNPAAKQLTDRLTAAKAKFAADQAKFAKLEKDAETSESAETQLELARAQMSLDEDEVEDARLDLARQGGDEHERLEQAAREHAEAQKEPAAVARPAALAMATLGEQAMAWWTLTERRARVWSGRQQAASRMAALEREHATLEALVEKRAAPAVSASDDEEEESGEEEEDPADVLARLKGLSDQRKTLLELDRRIQDAKQIEAAYQNWAGVLDARRRGVLHLLLVSLSLVLGVLLALVGAEAVTARVLGRHKDKRQAHQQRFLAKLGLRLVAALAVLLIVFGPPSQTPTIIGLATAGLTVALKDFIMAFLGWFLLMGRNGVRVGDWVEIKGVGGEVIEVGVFKTVLLEMGNWTNTGHPTGRRVSFMNGFAIEGHFFNFSTAGQWLWDELQVTVPAGGDPYAVAQRIREVVERETAGDAKEAAEDWERITRQYGTQQFSAAPAVDLRPGANGLEVQVRYITRGPRRYEVKSRMFREIVEVMR